MNPQDVQIIPATQGRISLEVRGKTEDNGLQLLQRIYVLLLSDMSDVYRNTGGASFSLLSFLEGANRPTDEVLNNILAICCGNVLNILDAEDRRHIQSLTATSTNSEITCVLVLSDGTTLTGTL